MAYIFLNCFYSILSGLVIYFSLVFIKQNWVNTIYYFITFLILPPIAFVITNIISNNLALSLGMIGALSIVRFRNPVKNPLELVIFFGLITTGISFGVNNKWGILLTTIIVSILILSHIFHIAILKYDKINLFKYSFAVNSGTNKNFIEVESSSKIEFLETNKYLIYSSSNNDGKYYYKLALDNKSNIKDIKKIIEKNESITSIDIQYGD
jgi:hypothetical protein